MLLSGERDGQVVAHGDGIYRFPGAGQPAEVPAALGAHLLAAGGFRSHDNRESRGTVHLQKDQGGCEITHRGLRYGWENDGDITEVPDELAMELVPLGGYRVVQPPVAQDPDGGDDDDSDPEQDDPDDSTEDGDADPDTGSAKPARRSRRKTA